MAWTTVDWQDADWALLANINDFIKAINERAVAAGLGPGGEIAEKNLGDDVQAAAFWNSLQTWIEDHDGKFLISHDAGVKRSADYYDTTDVSEGAEDYSDIAATFSAAGLATATWRAYPQHPTEGGEDQARKMEPGDIIGPWIFEDLQACLNVLIWTATESFKATTTQKYYGTATDEATWADAKAVAEADWQLKSDSSEYMGSQAAGYRDANGFQAVIRRMRIYQVSSANSMNRRVRWQILTEEDDTAWDNHDDPVGDNEGWVVWLVDDPDTSGTSSTFNSNLSSFPNWCPEPPMDTQLRYGWKSQTYDWTSVAIKQFDVEDGFVYV